MVSARNKNIVVIREKLKIVERIERNFRSSVLACFKLFSNSEEDRNVLVYMLRWCFEICKIDSSRILPPFYFFFHWYCIEAFPLCMKNKTWYCITTLMFLVLLFHVKDYYRSSVVYLPYFGN